MLLWNGAPERIRTSDRSVRSRVLYPAELRVHIDNSSLFLFREDSLQKTNLKWRRVRDSNPR